jgi:hypothetical protein
MKLKLVCLLLLYPLCLGCAVTRFDHMATTNWMDRTIVPDNRTAQWAMTPLLIPLCVGTLAVDNLLVAPAVHAPSAYGDAEEFFTASVGGYYTEMGVLPFRAAITPIVFVGSWMGRTFFAIEPRYDAAWEWPEWGRQWERDEDGKLIFPPDDPPPTAASRAVCVHEHRFKGGAK